MKTSKNKFFDSAQKPQKLKISDGSQNSERILKSKISDINKIYMKVGILIVFAILLSSFVFAFGVGSAYHQDKPLELTRGQTTEITFNLQNTAGGEDINAKATIEQGSEIIELVDSIDTFNIPIGGSVDVKARVTVPSDAEIGAVYPISITFTTLTATESGAFGLGSSVGRSFNVIVLPTAEEKAKIETQKKVASWAIYAVIGIVILIVIILIARLIMKRKRK